MCILSASWKAGLAALRFLLSKSNEWSDGIYEMRDKRYVTHETTAAGFFSLELGIYRAQAIKSFHTSPCAPIKKSASNYLPQ
jgi:hypothetical protein